MKIAFIITGLKTGGAERQVCDLADAMADKGHSVLLICLTAGVEIRPSNAQVQVKSIGGRKSIAGVAKIAADLKGTITHFRPDVVHSHLVHANIFIRILRCHTPIPILISTAHSTHEGGWYWRVAYRLTDWMCDITTNVSQAGVTAFVEGFAAPAHRIKCVYNGLNTTKFEFNVDARAKIRAALGVSSHQKILLNVGRLTAAKDQATLIRAFERLESQYSQVHLVIVGGGELHADLTALRDKSPSKNFIHFIPATTRVEEWMSAADVFVLTSRWEGFGIVLAEAMTLGCPIVSTRVGGTNEVIGDIWETCEPGNDRKIAELVKSIFEMPKGELMRRISESRRRISTFFSMDSISDQWIDLYSSLRVRKQNKTNPSGGPH